MEHRYLAFCAVCETPVLATSPNQSHMVLCVDCERAAYAAVKEHARRKTWHAFQCGALLLFSVMFGTFLWALLAFDKLGEWRWPME